MYLWIEYEEKLQKETKVVQQPTKYDPCYDFMRQPPYRQKSAEFAVKINK